MVSATTILATLTFGLLTCAMPTERSAHAIRQTIPENYLYAVERYPNGCGNGGGEVFYGAQETLATCTVPGGFDQPSDEVSVKFIFPDDGVTYQWKVFSSSDCSRQIAIGSGEVCTNVPVGEVIGAFIVYT